MAYFRLNTSNFMKTIAYLFRIILFYTVFFVAGCGQSTEFSLLDGERYSERDFRGQWLLVNFWAEWCAPCLEEIPDLNRFYGMGEKLNLKVIGISYDQMNNRQLTKLVKKLNIKYPVMSTEPMPILSFSMPLTLPTNYLIGPDGEVAVKLVGKQTLSNLKSALEKAKKSYEVR